VKATCLVAATVMLCGSSAWAQEAPSQARPQGVPANPAAATPRRDDIRAMEVLLTQALQKGAQDLARLIRVSEPNSAFVTGTGRARGFELAGYGVFFLVDVPNMKYSVVWSAQMVQLTEERDKWMQVLGTTRDEALRRLAEGQLRQTQRLMAAAQGGAVLIPAPPPVPNPTAPATMAPDRDRPVVAAVANAENGRALVDTTAPSGSLPVVAPPPDIRDPNELYSESVKNALIDAMLRQSQFLKIGDHEWLMIAASDSTNPRTGQLDEASPIVIRIKGSDLAAFHDKKISLEEVRKKVEVRDF
jgi:hypothetical protein